MGSEACDIDSFVSSLVTAIHEKAIFVVNMSRRILEAKGDVMYVLNHYSIDLDDLIFLERPRGTFSIDARRVGTTFRSASDEHKLVDKKVSLILVDHHRPVPELEDCPIELIIDHHVPGERSLAAVRIYVDTIVGSCATLVTKYIGHSLFHTKFNKCTEFESPPFCKGIAGMLMIPILVDTKNFKNVTSHFDRGEFNKLKKLSKTKRRTINKMRKAIKSARRNDADLDTDIIIQKDYKGFNHRNMAFGISTVKYSFKKWVDREAKSHGAKNSKNSGKYLEFALNDFKRDQGLDFIALNRKNGNKRFFAIFNCPFERVLARENNFELKNYKGFPYYEIPVTSSRKITVPVIKKLIDRSMPHEAPPK